MAWLGDFLHQHWLHKHWRGSLAIIGMSPMAIVALSLAGLPQSALMLATVALVAANMGLRRAVIRETAARLECAVAKQTSAEAILVLAHSDPVTGLLNKSGSDAQLPALARQLSEGEELLLMWIDLRHFREANNALGHARGDILLHRVGQRLREAAPADALVARVSGDRFLLAARLPSPEETSQLAGRINEKMAAPLHIGGHRITNGAAIGAAFMPRDARCVGTLQEAADLALYHARTADFGEMRFYDDGMHRAFDHAKQLEAALRDAIMKNDLSVAFQPLVDVRSGSIHAFEAEAWWPHPSGCETALDQIIAGSNVRSLDITIGNWTLAEAAKAATEWPDDVRLCVKLSPAHIMTPGAAQGVLAALSGAAFDPARLEMQVSGRVLRDETSTLAKFMEPLAARGVRFAVDDSEISRAGIDHIGQHPFSSIRTSCPPDSEASFRAIVSLGQSLGLEIVAVDIDTASGLHAARAAGFSLAMGRYISEAVSADIARELLAWEDKPAVVDMFSARKLAS